MLVSFVIPCHDESAALPGLFVELARVPALIAPHVPEFVFVDDGSTDGTLDLLYAHVDRSFWPCRVLGLKPNAGIGSAGTGVFDELTAENWMTVLRVNLIGPFLAVKHAARHMVPKGKGSIICTASVAGLRSGAGGTPYSASKAGVISLVQTSANEFYGTGVRVNAICPGLIETGMTRAVYEFARSRGTADRIGQLNPLARGGEPEEIAHAALFLASDDSSYVNGQAIVVDGGLSSSHPVARRGRR